MLLAQEEATKCETDVLNTCTSKSPVYVSGNHELCVLNLFMKNAERIPPSCKVELLTGGVLPQAISVADGIWAVAVEERIELSKVCDEKKTKSVKVKPPLTLVKLPLGCSAFGTSIVLPPFYQAEEKFELRDNVRELSFENGTGLWEPVIKGFPNVSLSRVPDMLQPLQKINLEQLLDKLSEIQRRDNNGLYMKGDGIEWLSLAIATFTLILVLVIKGNSIWKYLSKRKIKNQLTGVHVSELEEGRDAPPHDLVDVAQKDIEMTPLKHINITEDGQKTAKPSDRLRGTKSLK